VSPDYLASEFIHNVEVPSLLKRRESGELLIIPLIVDSMWSEVLAPQVSSMAFGWPVSLRIESGRSRPRTRVSCSGRGCNAATGRGPRETIASANANVAFGYRLRRVLHFARPYGL